ncbi:7-deoxyloganetin glucosyltransferase-like [Aristolochia californica]|uniref:7-deoxyloganetin glucosyltransferase-like n=1 Tax=Aristolochia californica TaxID=171875 RepID=UPI0035DB2743
MGSFAARKLHAICVPFPAQGHLTPMMKVAKLLHQSGFHITFVNTEYNHQRLLRSRGSGSLEGLEDFRFTTIPDGLPPSNSDVTQSVPALCESTSKTCLAPFRDLVSGLNDDPTVPPVSCIMSDGVMSFTLDVAEELGIPEVLFWTTSACGLLGYAYYQLLIEKGIIPLKDESYLTNGYLDKPMDWLQGMKDVRLRDFPSFLRTTDGDDIMVNFAMNEIERVSKSSALILNTFEELEDGVLGALRTMFPRIYTIGSLSLLCDRMKLSPALKSIGSNLWKEDRRSLEWLDTKEPGSVVYVNFGSITVMSPQQMREFAWGLADSNHTFLWVIRPDLVEGDSAIIPPEFIELTGDRSLLMSWVPQEQVLSHPSIGGFLTHSGWNSTLESIVSGVPMICWPFFAEQQTNCRFSCIKWEIGMEIDSDVKREEVTALVRELMDGERGKKMKKKAVEWKDRAQKAANLGGSSYVNLEKIVKDILSL